jgi:hypothetical protein
MPATAADIGYGALFGIEGATPGTYVSVAEVVSITPPGMTRDKEEATHLLSDDQYKEYVAGLFDTGDASITLNFIPSATDAVFAAFHAESGRYQITFPGGVMMRFTGFFTAYTPPELTPGGKMQSTATISRKTGKPTLHAPG